MRISGLRCAVLPIAALTGALPATPAFARDEPAAEEADVHFDSESPDLELHVRTGDSRGASHYERICASPCEAALRTGRQRLALSKRGASPVEADENVDIEGPSTIRGKYVSHEHARTGGLVFLVLGDLGGVGLLYVGFKKQCHWKSIDGTCAPESGILSDGNPTAVIAGLIVMATATAIGIGGLLKGDDVIIEVTPLDTALRWPSRVAREGGWMASPGEGIGLRLRF